MAEDRGPSEGKPLSGETQPPEEKQPAKEIKEDTTAKRDELQRQVEQKIKPKHADKEVFPIYQVPRDLLRRYEYVFIQPASFPDAFAVGQNSEKRVFLVHGDDPEWNFVCGVQLGAELIRDRHDIAQPVVMVYRREASDTRSLMDFVRQRRAADAGRLKTQGTVYVIENAFQRGIRLADLDEISLGHLNSELANLRSYLVLTNPSPRVEPIPGVEALGTTVASEVLLKKFLTYYREGRADEWIADRVIELALEAAQKLSDDLKTYTLVKRFCSAIADLPVDCQPAALIEAARAVAQADQRESGDRFRSLAPNAKLYAMLAVLFDNVEEEIVDEIYIAAVRNLRQQGVNNLRDARQFGLLDMLEEIQAERGTDGRIHFRSPRFKEHICRQQIANHHHLLWSLIEMLCDLIGQYRDEQYTSFRESLGTVIGQLGIGYEAKLFALLEKLAGHQDGRVASVPAYALEEICRRYPEKFDTVAELITRWTESLDPDLMWAAGVAIGRMYRSVAPAASSDGTVTNRLQDILTDLAASVERSEQVRQWLERNADFNELLSPLPPELQSFLVELAANGFFEVIASSVAQAMHWIAASHAEDAAKLITRWLEADPRSRTGALGILMAVQLFRENSGDEISLNEKVHTSLLGLVGPLVRATAQTRNGDPLDTVVETLEMWLSRNAESGWGVHIHAALLQVVNRATLDERRMLQVAFTAHFLVSETPQTRRIGQALSARCAAMDGIPMDMPGRRYGVIALDASYQRRLMPIVEAGRNLYLHLDGRVDTWLLAMGNSQTAIGPNQVPLRSDLQNQGDLPRLLATVLERRPTLDPAQAHFVLALTGGPIVDAEDLHGTAWQEGLIIVGPDPAAKWQDDVPFVRIDRYPNDSDLRCVENRINQHLGRRLAAFSPDDWWPTLIPYLKYDPTDLDGICAQLSAWAKNLDNVEGSKHPGDVTHTIACTVLWLVRVDFARCLTLLEELLAAADETQRIMGLACVKLLFNVYGQQTPPARFETLGPILKLVPALARTNDWGAILAVLQAFRSWLTDPVWAQRILGASAREGEVGASQVTDESSSRAVSVKQSFTGSYADLLSALTDHTPAANRNDLKQMLGVWRVEKDAPDALRQAADRMLVRVLLGEGGKLSDLPQGQRYGLILLDASRERGDLARVAAQLAKELPNNAGIKDKFYPVTWRLGQRMPVAVKGQTRSVEELAPAGLYPLPRLAGPAFDLLAEQEKQVGFVLLLCNGAILDQEDWHESWKGVPTFVYSSTSRKLDWTSSFRVIPRQGNEQDAARGIVSFLLTALKG